jgi:zinc transport system permease protein
MMMEFLSQVWQLDFMRNALLACVLVSIVAGVIGTLVVLNQIVFISGGIAHAAYGGVGIAYYLGFNPVLGAVGFSVLSSLAMGLVQRSQRQRADTLIGVMWAFGMAIGIIFLSMSPGYKADLMSYLFGSILAVSALDLWLTGVIVLFVLVFVGLFYRPLLAISFDETFSTVRNLKVSALYMAMILLIGLSVVIAMRVVGLILVIALLTIPAAIAGLFLRDMRKMMLLASGLSLVLSLAGLLLAYALNLPAGAVIILTMVVAYLTALLVAAKRDRRHPSLRVL